MTKKHYEAIAVILKSFNSGLLTNVCIKPMAKHLAEYFEQENPRFNRDKFLTACGIETENECVVCDAPLKNRKCPFGC